MKKFFLAILLALASTTVFASTQAKAVQDKPWRVYMLGGIMNTSDKNHSVEDDYFYPATNPFVIYDTQIESGKSIVWADRLGGIGSGTVLNNSVTENFYVGYTNYDNSLENDVINLNWTGVGDEYQDTHQWGSDNGNNYDYPNHWPMDWFKSISSYVVNEHCAVTDPQAHPPLWTFLEFTSNFGPVLRQITQTDHYQRYAQAVWHVQTGGKAIPGRRGLWRFYSSAWSVLDMRAAPPFINVAMPEITNKTQISIGGLGSLKADGNLWLTLPEDVGEDITPVVAGNDFYTFSVGGQKYPLNISLATVTTNANLDTDVPGVGVGQLVKFTLNGLPTGSFSNMLGTWGLPTKYVNEQWQHLQWVVTEPISGSGYWQPYGSVNYRINSSLLENTNQTSCWFVNGNGGHVTVNLNLQFPNGQFVSVAANGGFLVLRPTVTNLVPDNPISVVLDTNSLPSIYLGLGDAGGGSGGMGWNLDVHWKTNFNGTFFYTQLIDREWSWDITTFHLPLSRSTGGFWLDNGNPYSAASILDTSVLRNPKYVATLSFGDGPSLTDSFYSFADLNDSFHTYLEFQPPGGIPITIGLVSWGWHGQTAVSSGVWSLATDTVTGPSLDDTSDAFPEWTTILYNSKN